MYLQSGSQGRKSSTSREPRWEALEDFKKARRQAAIESLLDRLKGKHLELLSYQDVAHQLKVTGQSERGLQDIPVRAIVGSVGRYKDFSRTFLPLRESDAGRWTSVKSAAGHVSQLPPIEVYQIGEAYFVQDGNHRVSVARQQGLEYVQAVVTEVRTRVPLPANVQPDELIVRAEYAAFLERTHLDRLVPDADLSASVPGQYERLENHIEAHRYFIESAEECELTDEKAVIRWYDDAYLPVVIAIREQGLMRDFPGWTETDLYLWIAMNQAALRNELGWQVTPEATVQFAPKARHRVDQAYNKVLHVVIPEGWRRHSGTEAWAQRKALDRYSQRLFADILVPVNLDDSWQALNQALVVASHEGSHLYGLHVVADGTQKDGAESELVRQAFSDRCHEAGVDGTLAIEGGKAVDKVSQRALMTDLVILNPNSALLGQTGKARRQALGHIVTGCERPVLIVPYQAHPLGHILLISDEHSKEALFAAVYLAERWGAVLTVLATPEKERARQELTTSARNYLELHEVEATFVSGREMAAAAVCNTAADHGCGLIVLGGQRVKRISKGEAVYPELQATDEWDRPVLFCG